MEGLRAGSRADAVDELVEVNKGERERHPLDLSLAHVGAPGEIAAQLRVGHGLVGGEVALELDLVRCVVLVVGHEAGLLDKEASVGPGAGLGTTGERAHLAQGLGEIACKLGAAQEDRLVGIRARGR